MVCATPNMAIGPDVAASGLWEQAPDSRSAPTVGSLLAVGAGFPFGGHDDP